MAPEALEQALLDVVAPYRFEDTRLHQVFERDEVPAKLIQKFARGTYASASRFLGILACLADSAPDPAARLFLLENLMEEEGIIFKPSSGLAVRPEQRHVELAGRFVRASGLEAEVLSGDATFMQSSAGKVGDMVAEGRWLEAVAYMLVGQELKAGQACATIVERLKAHGFTDRDLAFFEVHIEADAGHGQQALEIVTRLARDADSQAAVIRAAQQGAQDWFDSYGGAARQVR